MVLCNKKGDGSMESSNDWLSWLKFIAWVQFIGGVIAAIFIFQEYGIIEVPREGFAVLAEEATNWVGLGAGIGLILGSLLIMAMLYVICMMTEQLFEIDFYTGMMHDEIKRLRSELHSKPEKQQEIM